MRPAYRADEANFPPPSLPGNHAVNPAVAANAPSRHQIPAWLPALILLAILSSASQAQQTIASVDDDSGVAATLPDSPGTVSNTVADPQPLLLNFSDFGYQNPGPFNTTQNSRNPNARNPCGATTANATRRGYPRFRRDPCDPYRPFVDTTVPPLTSKEKGILAFHDVTDPFNLLTIAATSAFTIGINSHTAYGPGMRGFGYNVGTSLGQDVTGEFIGTYAVCSIFREDPRYFRMPDGKFWPRLWHAVNHIAVARGDNGRNIPNYSNLITAAAGAELANLYVPGLATDGASTAERIFTGFLTEPIGNIIAEFLPDVASKIHVRNIVVQRLLNKIANQPD